MLRPFAHSVACYCAEFESGQTFARLFQHCLDHARASHMVSLEVAKSYGFYPSHDALQVLTLFGVVASVFTPLPKRTQQLPTFLAQQVWELLRPFALSFRLRHFFCAESNANELKQ